MPIVAGTLTVIGGLFFFVSVELWAFWPLFLTAIFAVVGGVYTWERRKWPIALAGSISALFNLLFISTTLYEHGYGSDWSLALTLIGIAAVVLTVLSKKEFK